MTAGHRFRLQRHFPLLGMSAELECCVPFVYPVCRAWCCQRWRHQGHRHVLRPEVGAGLGCSGREGAVHVCCQRGPHRHPVRRAGRTQSRRRLPRLHHVSFATARRVLYQTVGLGFCPCPCVGEATHPVRGSHLLSMLTVLAHHGGSCSFISHCAPCTYSLQRLHHLLQHGRHSPGCHGRVSCRYPENVHGVWWKPVCGQQQRHHPD